MPDTNEKRVDTTQRLVDGNRLLGTCRSFPVYLKALWKQAPLYAHWKRVSTLLRRFRAVSITVRIITTLFAILQTGTLLLLTAVFLLIAILLGGIFMLVLLLISTVRAGKTNRILEKHATGRSVCLLFMHPTPSAFFWQNATDLSARGCLVLIVSPYWISPRGMAQSGFYLTARREADRLYIIRKYYLFSLRRHVLNREKSVYFY